MGMRYEGEQVQREFENAFGFSPDDITPAQAMVLTKIIKHARLRCRSNAALYPYLGRVFGNLRFREEVTKNPPGSRFPESKRLRITQKVAKVPAPDPAKMTTGDAEEGGDDEE